MTLTTIAIAAAWTGCGVLHAGLWYAFFQRRFVFKKIAEDERFVDGLWAVITIPLGLIALLATLLTCGIRYGWVLPFTDPFRKS